MALLFVKEVMTTELDTTTSDTPLAEAARIMAYRKLGCLPVVEDGKLVGILTEGDLARMAAKG